MLVESLVLCDLSVQAYDIPLSDVVGLVHGRCLIDRGRRQYRIDEIFTIMASSQDRNVLPSHRPGTDPEPASGGLLSSTWQYLPGRYEYLLISTTPRHHLLRRERYGTGRNAHSHRRLSYGWAGTKPQPDSALSVLQLHWHSSALRSLLAVSLPSLAAASPADARILNPL